ncbi:hypothetical protein [Roseomonas sp. AR75]|uniref:hypothetical protein n=1 Tax=Roseomonas sp. AR75 TaxID=2562311 RepID=UPI0010BFD87C|nr:hypothetical protein [Roseomonas sp. AR75]
MATFQYLLDKVRQAPFETEPFKHVYITDFFSRDDFARIVADPQIKLRPAKDDRDLVNTLHAAGYKEISFPGTTTDVETYLAWHNSGARQTGVNNENCEGFGVTMRLKQPQPGSILADLDRFMRTRAFWSVLADKFGIDLDDVTPDSGIQKYLDGYEISPHPDIRRKALTFMININPAEDSENIEYHTHYMRFKPEHDHIRVKWRDETDKEREWVPWSNCETIRLQRPNNSIVIFHPTEETLHAVRANYDHLGTQRTQCYGNLWYSKPGPLGSYWSMPATVARKVVSIFR